MFSTNTFHGVAKPPRNSRRSTEFGGTNFLSFSQEETNNVGRIRRASMDATATGTASRILECGVHASPIAYLYSTYKKSGSLRLYGAEEVGPVSIVGIGHSGKTISDSLIQFNLTDGTGMVIVKYDIPNSPEGLVISSLVTPLVSIPEDDENVNIYETILKPIRIVGICEISDSDIITVRAVNVRAAAKEEYGYYHMVNSATQYMRHIKKVNKNSKLPSRFNSVKDPVEEFVLKTVLAEREEGLGVSKSDLVRKGRASGFIEDDISQALADLDANNLILVIEADGVEPYVDIMPERHSSSSAVSPTSVTSGDGHV